MTELHHHGAEVVCVEHLVAGDFHGDALFLAQFVEGLGVLLEMGRLARLDDLGAGKVESQLRDAALHVFLFAENDEVGHAPAQQNVGGQQDSVGRLRIERKRSYSNCRRLSSAFRTACS